MVYENFVIGGLTPSRVLPDVTDDRLNHRLTIKCASLREEYGGDPMGEIEAFNSLAASKVVSKPLLKGGANVGVTPDGELITVTDGVNTWVGGLHRIESKYDDYGDQFLYFDLVLDYIEHLGGGFYVYFTPYGSYSNINYHMFTDDSLWGDDSDSIEGTEIGIMTITESRFVKKVIVEGSACVGGYVGQNYLDLNGEQIPWNVCHDYAQDGNVLPPGVEELEFDLNPAVKVLTLRTPNHVLPSTGVSTNLGCWPLSVKVFYV